MQKTRINSYTYETGAWYVSIIEAAVYGITFVVAILFLRRTSHKNKLQRARGNLIMETKYQHNTELETSYTAGVGKTYLPVSVESPHV
jgi:hypothetical protein